MGNDSSENVSELFIKVLPSVISLGLRDEVTLAVEKVLNSPVSFPFTFQEAIRRDIVWNIFMNEENIEELVRGVFVIILVKGASPFFQELYDSINDTENLEIFKHRYGEKVVALWIRNMQISLYVLTHYADRFFISPHVSDRSSISGNTTPELPQPVESQIAPVQIEERHENISDVIEEHQKMEMNGDLGKNTDKSEIQIITQIVEENIKNLFKKLTRGETKTMIGLIFYESISTKQFEEFLVSLNGSEKRVSTKIANLLRSLYTNKYYNNKASYILPSNTDESISAISHLRHLVMNFIDYQEFLPEKSPVVPVVTVSKKIENSPIVGEVAVSLYPQNIESTKVAEFIQILKTAKDTKGNTGAYELFLVGLRDSILQGDVKKMLVSLKEKYKLPQIPGTVPALITRLQGGIYRAVGEVGMLPYLQSTFKSFYPEIISQEIPNVKEDLPVPVIVEEPPKTKEDLPVIIKVEPIVKQPEEVKQTISSKKTEESWENRAKFLFDAQDSQWTRETLIPFLESLHLYFTKNNPSLLSQIRKNIEKNNIGVERLVSSVRALVIQGGNNIQGSYSAIFAGAQRILDSKDSKLVLRYMFFYPFDREVGGGSVPLKTDGSSITEKKTIDPMNGEGAERILVERMKNLDLFKDGILISVDLFQQQIDAYNDFQTLGKLLSDWNEFHNASMNGNQNVFPYIWAITRKIQSINASNLLNQPQCGTLLGQLRKILGKYKDQKDFLQKIPEDLKDFLANNYKIELSSSSRMIGSTPQRGKRGFIPKARL